MSSQHPPHVWPRHGWFSATAFARHGGARYTTTAGAVVTITCLGTSPEEQPDRWPDSTYVGEVDLCLGRVAARRDQSPSAASS